MNLRMSLAVVILALWSVSVVQADPIEVSGTDINEVLLRFNAGTVPIADGIWSVSFHEDSYENLATQLVAQEWWNEMFVARAFAEVVGEVPGVNNLGLGLGPMFLVDFGPEDNLLWASWSNGFRFSEGAGPAIGAFPSRILAYAKAELINVPEPGTLALFGIGLAGMGLAKRRRTVRT